MLKIFKLILLFSVFVLVSFSSSEANWWKDQKLSGEMKLIKEDIETFEKVFAENRKEVLELQTEIKKLNIDLMQILRNDKISKEKKSEELNKTVKKIVKLRGDIALKIYSVKMKILSMLTVKQLNILTAKFPNIIQKRWSGRNIGFPRKIKGKVTVK